MLGEMLKIAHFPKYFFFQADITSMVAFHGKARRNQ